MSEAYAVFRPRLARVATLAVAAVVLIGTGLLLLAMALPPADRIAFAAFGLLVAWFCWRQASVRAVPDDDGLTVRNLLVSRRLSWAQVVSVRFGEGRPWVQLDLDDGDTLAVMGIQRSDGARAQTEARRLATLVARHTETGHDD